MIQESVRKILIVSAPSGTGKTTVVKNFLALAPDWKRVISCTTRPPRQDEQYGVDYKFMSEETFQVMLARQDFLVYKTLYGHHYGTLRDDLIAVLQQGLQVVLILDPAGTKDFLQLIPTAVSVFLMPPSKDELERRIRKRGTDSEEVIAKRLIEADAEMAESASYQHVLVNTDSNVTAQKLLELVGKIRG